MGAKRTELRSAVHRADAAAAEVAEAKGQLKTAQEQSEIQR